MKPKILIHKKKPPVSVKARTVSLLARREYSRSELRVKLLHRGYLADEVEEAIEWAVAHQIQSDDRFKLSLFKRRASTYGNRLILTELAQHGVCNLESLRLNHTQSNDNQIEDVIASEQDRAYDWIKRRQRSDLQALIEGGLATAQTQTQILILKSKIFKSLSARGFEFDHIDQAWRRIMSELKLNT